MSPGAIEQSSVRSADFKVEQSRPLAVLSDDKVREIQELNVNFENFFFLNGWILVDCCAESSSCPVLFFIFFITNITLLYITLHWMSHSVHHESVAAVTQHYMQSTAHSQVP